MKQLTCELQDGKCVNCGGTTEGRRCRATVPLAELYAMHFGAIPTRCVRMTMVQVRALQSIGEAGGQWSAGGPCVHRGEQTRQQVCTTCKGKQRIKVFACTIHGECTLGKKLKGLACCAGCTDYKP